MLEPINNMSESNGEGIGLAFETQPVTIQLEQMFDDSQLKFTTDLEQGYNLTTISPTQDINNRTSFLYNRFSSSSFTLNNTELSTPAAIYRSKHIIQTWEKGGIRKSMQLSESVSEEKETKKVSKTVDLEYMEDGKVLPIGNKIEAASILLRNYNHAEFDPEKTNAQFQRLKNEGQNVKWNSFQ